MDRKTWKTLVSGKFREFETFLRDQAKARDAIREKRANAAKMYSEFLPEVVERKLSEIAKEREELDRAAKEKGRELIRGLVEAMEARAAESLDLSDQDFTTAVNLINVLGDRLPYSEQIAIVDTFTGDQAALRTIEKLFEAKGLAKGAELARSKQYTPALVGATLLEYNNAAFQPDGSLNTYASEIRRIALKEGYTDFPSMVDEAGAMEATRAAAGLSHPGYPPGRTRRPQARPFPQSMLRHGFGDQFEN